MAEVTDTITMKGHHLPLMIEVTEAQKAALSLLGFWWRCIEAERQLNEEEQLHDDAIIFHFSGAGASAMVTVKHLRDIASIT